MHRNENEAIQEYEQLTYRLAKEVSKLNEIRERMKYLNQREGWDGMFELQFDDAMVNLANVQAAAIMYALENKNRKRDIEEMKSELKFLEETQHDEH